MRFLTTLLYIICSIAFFIAAISIIRYLLATEFPTHSDVFWIGAQAGVLGVSVLILLALGLLLLYCIATRKPQTT
jgi:uncharacterized membrane protein YedE/YeeE